MRSWALLSLLLALETTARPVDRDGPVHHDGPTNHDGLSFHSLKARRANKPTLKLPYGTWQATKYDTVNDLYIFENIRFAAPPVGPLGFANPAPSEPVEDVQIGSYGPAFSQFVPSVFMDGGGAKGLLSSIIDMITSSFDMATIESGASSVGEDCLCLDLSVPAKALNGEVKFPIVNWIHGGPYLLGSKEDMYDTAPSVKASGGSVIFVSGNYRLGASGWFAGDTIEKEGTSNTGLWDQTAIFDWIQKYADHFGGDKENVTVMGEPAGAGSIPHRLTKVGGKQRPLSKRAILQRPALDSQVDRQGQLGKQKQSSDVSKAAGCAGKDLACTRAKSLGVLRLAEEKSAGQLQAGDLLFYMDKRTNE